MMAPRFSPDGGTARSGECFGSRARNVAHGARSACQGLSPAAALVLSSTQRFAAAFGLAGLLVAPASSAPTREEPRTLDEITIEGEIAMPQVLFITAREPYRFVDTAHRAYLLESEEVRALVVLPFPFWIGRTLLPSVSMVHVDDSFPPPGEGAAPDSPVRSQGRN